MPEAARRLGWCEATVRNHLRKGKLLGSHGPQPVRPRLYVAVDADGAPLTPDGPHPAFKGTGGQPESNSLLRRVEELERRRVAGGTEHAEELLAALTAALEHQRRAAQLQSEAVAELGESQRIQSELMTRLLTAASADETEPERSS